MFPPEFVWFLIGALCGMALPIMFWLMLRIISPWLKAITSGAQVSCFAILGMRLRGNPPHLLIDAYLSLLHSGQKVELREVESAYIAQRGQIVTAEDLVNAVLRRRES